MVLSGAPTDRSENDLIVDPKMLRDICNDASQRADSERIVVGNANRVFAAFKRANADMTTALPNDLIPTATPQLRDERSGTYHGIAAGTHRVSEKS